MPGFKGLAVPGPTNLPFEIRQAMEVPLEDHRAPDFPDFTLPLFADLKVNIDAANCAEAPDGRAENLFRFHAKDLSALNAVTRRLEGLKGVFSVSRVRE